MSILVITNPEEELTAELQGHGLPAVHWPRHCPNPEEDFPAKGVQQYPTSILEHIEAYWDRSDRIVVGLVGDGILTDIRS